MNDLFLKYGVLYGKRFRFKDKLKFVNEFAKDIESLGYKVEFQAKKKKFEKLLNIYVGDMKNAKIIFIAAYDTPTKAFIPQYKYYPFHTEKNIHSDTICFVAQFLISMLLVIISFILLSQFNRTELLLKIFISIIAVILLFFAVVITSGISNPFNNNRNTASVILCYSLAESLKNRKDIAFVFLDNGISSFSGYRECSARFIENIDKKKFVILNALAIGETLVLAHGNQMKEDASLIIKIANDLVIKDRLYGVERIDEMVLKYFPLSMILASGRIWKNEFVVEKSRTAEDYKIDLIRLERIKRILETYIKSQ